ncbi:MAG: PHB depolymerase family esterase [Marinicellaceae bacterium]
MINKYIIFILLSATFLASCQPTDKNNDTKDTGLFNFDIDKKNMTVSGISAGGYMATQFHVAYSSQISGVGILAGGPYWCARGEITRALGYCMKGGGGTDPKLINEYIEQSRKNKKIDNTSNLKTDKVWIFHGAKDMIMANSISRAIKDFYAQFTESRNIQEVYDVAANHGMPTLSTGVQCDTIGGSFLNACNYDAAGEMLKTFYGEVNKRTEATGSLIKIDQSPYKEAHLTNEGYLYVPNNCQDNQTCQLHTVFHGCMQSTEFIGEDFIKGAGYNEWAESNNIVIFYPQVKSSQFAPMNPKGCWDWWGYTNENYANNKGPQMMAIHDLIKTIAGIE